MFAAKQNPTHQSRLRWRRPVFPRRCGSCATGFPRTKVAAPYTAIFASCAPVLPFPFAAVDSGRRAADWYPSSAEILSPAPWMSGANWRRRVTGSLHQLRELALVARGKIGGVAGEARDDGVGHIGSPRRDGRGVGRSASTGPGGRRYPRRPCGVRERGGIEKAPPERGLSRSGPVSRILSRATIYLGPTSP